MGAAQPFNTSQIDTFFAEYAKSIQGFVDAGRQVADRAAQQNTEAVAAWKGGLDVLADAWQKSAQAQHEIATIAVERVQTVSRLVTENVESVTKTLTGIASAYEVPSTFVATVQKQAAELVAAQKKAYDAASQQAEATGKAALESFQRGVETVVEAQKAVLRPTA